MPSLTSGGILATSQLSKTNPVCGSGVIEGVNVGSGVGVCVAVLVAVGLAVGLGGVVAVSVGVALGRTVGVAVSVGKGVAVGANWLNALHALSKMTARIKFSTRRNRVILN